MTYYARGILNRRNQRNQRPTMPGDLNKEEAEEAKVRARRPTIPEIE